MYERFTVRARKVMQLANQEAQRFNHEYVGTEHLLLGLVKEKAGLAAVVLKRLGIGLPDIRLEVEKIIQSGPANLVTPGRLPQTPRAKKVIEYAIEEARNFEHNYVATEHLLLGLIRDWESVAVQILLNLGIRLDHVRDALRGAIESPSYLQEQTAAESVQCLPPGRFADARFQRAQDVDHVQDGPAPESSDSELCLEFPDLERLVARPGGFRRAWNYLLGLVRRSRPSLPTYQDPPAAHRFTARSRLVFHQACLEAFRMSHEYIGTEHVLLGLLDEGTACRILKDIGISAENVLSEVFRLVQYGPELLRVPQAMPWTPRSLNVLVYACQEADHDGQQFVRPEHLLLGAISEDEGVAGHVLRNLGLTPERVRSAIQQFHS
jgi:ATP-dependent Clp protease ATP-binding subunit ClpA